MINSLYYMAVSASGQDELNLVCPVSPAVSRKQLVLSMLYIKSFID